MASKVILKGNWFTRLS